jgi:hypothetical protein
MGSKLIVVFIAVFFGAVAFSQTASQDTTYEDLPAIELSNGKLNVTLVRQGGAIASVVLADDPDKLNPMWDPRSAGRAAGRGPQPYNGTLGHFVAVDGFGQPSAEERAAGIPQHGEAHVANSNITPSTDANSTSITMTANLPIVEETFTRTYRLVNGENVMYVDNELESLVGFDRPVIWAEHATIAAPFLKPGATTITLSGTRSQNRDYTATNPAGRGNNPGANAPGRNANAGGPPGANAPAGAGRGAQTQRRLAPGKDFTWPMAPGLNGEMVDLSIIPEDPHFVDHAATLMDPGRDLEFVAALNTEKRLAYGYVFRREDYPWIQHWHNWPSVAGLTTGMEFGTTPYDMPRHDVIEMSPLFGTPTYRWLRAKGKIESHFIAFYTHVPEGFHKIDDIRLDNGEIVVEDRSDHKQITLAASRGLSLSK